MTNGELYDYIRKQMEGFSEEQIDDWRPASGFYIDDIVKTDKDGSMVPNGIRLWLTNGDSVIYAFAGETLEGTAHTKTNGTGSGDAKVPDLASEKPPIGCKPYYVHIAARIRELCGAIVRNAAEKDRHNQIRLWLKEIWLLNETDRELRHEEKNKVWEKDADGKLQEMP